MEVLIGKSLVIINIIIIIIIISADCLVARADAAAAATVSKSSFSPIVFVPISHCRRRRCGLFNLIAFTNSLLHKISLWFFFDYFILSSLFNHLNAAVRALALFVHPTMTMRIQFCILSWMRRRSREPYAQVIILYGDKFTWPLWFQSNANDICGNRREWRCHNRFTSLNAGGTVMTIFRESIKCELFSLLFFTSNLQNDIDKYWRMMINCAV